MKKKIDSRRIIRLLGSSGFFWCIMALFAVQAAWIALSGRYPMAFDEDFHLGVIRLYTHHLAPFWSSQPTGADPFGPIFRDPSYLYHWLMSFPYRVISVFTQDQTVQVIILRFINIGLLAAALPIYRRLLLKTRASKAIVNVSLLVFVLIPVVPLLGAQINYDNLFIPLVGLFLLAAVNFSGSLRPGRFDSAGFLKLAILGLLISLVKYAFLPVLIAAVFYLLIRCLRVFKGLSGLWGAFGKGLRQISKPALALLVLALLIAVGLFGERYFVNLFRYHTPVPTCDQVLIEDSCKAYGPWQRDQYYISLKDHSANNPFAYTADWFYGMWLRLYFSVDGPATNFETRGPLVLPGLSAIPFAAAGSLAFIAYARRVFRKYNGEVLGFLASVTVVYALVLWLNGFQAYMRTGQPVAINGRYLLPVLPFLFIGAALALNELFGRHEESKLAVTGVAVLCLIWGGGALTYILRSRDVWLWPDATVQSVNRDTRQSVGPVIPGYRHPTEYMH